LKGIICNRDIINPAAETFIISGIRRKP